MNKRGMNMILVGALLIALAVFGATMIFSWGHGMTEEMKESGTQSLSDVECISKVTVYINSACISEDKLKLTIANKGESDITGWTLKVIRTGKEDTDIYTSSQSLIAGATGQIEVSIDTSNIISVEAIPDAIINGRTGKCQTAAVKTLEIRNC